jgi:ABC-type molybdate transport system ATPase subunit
MYSVEVLGYGERIVTGIKFPILFVFHEVVEEFVHHGVP